MDEKLYFTRKGIRKLCGEIEKLTKKLADLQSQTAYIAEVGGDQYHDNASYEMLTIDIRGIDRRVSDAHRCLNMAVVVDSPINTKRVTIGVKVKILRDGEESVWEIAGFGESDPDKKIIAYNTLLASLLLGKQKYEIIQGTIAGKRTEIEILDITIGGGDEQK